MSVRDVYNAVEKVGDNLQEKGEHDQDEQNAEAGEHPSSPPMP